LEATEHAVSLVPEKAVEAVTVETAAEPPKEVEKAEEPAPVSNVVVAVAEHVEPAPTPAEPTTIKSEVNLEVSAKLEAEKVAMEKETEKIEQDKESISKYRLVRF